MIRPTMQRIPRPMENLEVGEFQFVNGTVAHLPVRFSEAVSASHIAPLEASYDLAPVLTALYIDISDGGPRQHRSGCCPPRPVTLGTENRFLKIRRTCRSVFGGLTSPARRCTLRLNLFTRPIQSRWKLYCTLHSLT